VCMEAKRKYAAGQLQTAMDLWRLAMQMLAPPEFGGETLVSVLMRARARGRHVVRRQSCCRDSTLFQWNSTSCVFEVGSTPVHWAAVLHGPTPAQRGFRCGDWASRCLRAANAFKCAGG
jgi:hypothetical protein